MVALYRILLIQFREFLFGLPGLLLHFLLLDFGIFLLDDEVIQLLILLVHFQLGPAISWDLPHLERSRSEVVVVLQSLDFLTTIFKHPDIGLVLFAPIFRLLLLPQMLVEIMVVVVEVVLQLFHCHGVREPFLIYDPLQRPWDEGIGIVPSVLTIEHQLLELEVLCQVAAERSLSPTLTGPIILFTLSTTTLPGIF